MFEPLSSLLPETAYTGFAVIAAVYLENLMLMQRAKVKLLVVAGIALLFCAAIYPKIAFETNYAYKSGHTLAADEIEFL